LRGFVGSNILASGLLRNATSGWQDGLTITPYEKDPSLWMIFGLEVKLSARGLGIGRSLVSAALSQGKKLGAQRIGLFVKKNACPALGLYYSLGFKKSCDLPGDFNLADDEIYLVFKADDTCDWRAILDSSVSEGVFYPLYVNILRSRTKDACIPAG